MSQFLIYDANENIDLSSFGVPLSSDYYLKSSSIMPTNMDINKNYMYCENSEYIMYMYLMILFLFYVLIIYVAHWRGDIYTMKRGEKKINWVILFFIIIFPQIYLSHIVFDAVVNFDKHLRKDNEVHVMNVYVNKRQNNEIY